MIVVLSENNSTFPLNNGFIYRGDTFKSKDYPYIMYLRFWSVPKTKGYGSCTGSLVKKLFILTAGHCCNGHTVDDIEVRVVTKLHFKCVCLHILSSTKTF